LAVVDACVYITSAYFFIVFFIICLPARSTLFPYTTLFRSDGESVSLVHDIYLGPNSSSAGLYGFAEFNGALYFTAYDPDNGHERSEEHTSELQSRENFVCRLLLEKNIYGIDHHFGTVLSG